MSNIIKACRKVVITGGVAVGKTSITKQVCDYLDELNIKWLIVPEYIDIYDDGLEMLNKYLNHIITAFEFQKYVIRFYDEYLQKLEREQRIDENTILVFERTVDDSITCFSNLDYRKGNISLLELCELYNDAVKIDIQYNLPSYFISGNRIFIPIKNDEVERDGKIIANIIDYKIKNNIIIGLYNTDHDCFERMVKRNREGEIESYTQDVIAKFNNTYNNLYNLLMSQDIVDFIDLGKLSK